MDDMKWRRRQMRGALAAAGGVLAAFALGGVALWAMGGGFGHAASAARISHIVSPGMAAPDFSLPTSDGRTMHLADYRGRAVFVAYVPSFDDPATLAEVRSLRDKTSFYDQAGAKVLLVGPANISGAKEAAARLHDQNRLPFPVCLDAGNALAQDYTIPAGYRNSFVITPKGQVRYRFAQVSINPATHGQQLIDVSKCCLDDVLAARAHGIGKAVGEYSLPRADAAGGAMQTILGGETRTATVVLFLSVKCPCSNAYDDRLRDWARTYTAKGIRFVGVYSNKDESLAEIAAHARTHGFDFPVFRDDHALCADHFGAQVTPEVFVLDAKNVLRYAGRMDDNREPAQVTTHELTATLDALLANADTNAVVPHETRAFGCGIVR